MKTIPSIDLLEAAAYALVSERCRASYLHDMRGGLQALQGGIELLVRAAKISDPNSALADKAAGLARNALLKHEKSIVELLDQTTPQREDASTLNVGEVVGEVLRFARNDAANKSITFSFEAPQDVFVLAQRHKFRLLMLGLCIALFDELAPGSIVEVSVARSKRDALIEFASTLPCPAILKLEELWGSDGPRCSLRELLLSLTQAWASGHGGCVELSAGANLPNALRLYYPLHAAYSQTAEDSGPVVGVGTI